MDNSKYIYLTPKENNKFEGLQALRFFAALMVVITHTTFFISTRVPGSPSVWEDGAQGVNIFFVISGFVMYLSAQSLVDKQDRFRIFALSRLIRIVPLYWTLNALKIVQILVLPSLALANPNWSNIVLSMLFVPSRNADGIIETFYGVGWTLNFEMFFYLLVGLALLWRVSILGMVSTVLITFAALSAVRQESWPAITYLFQPIVLNFLWGVGLAALHMRGFAVPWPLAAAMIVFGFTLAFVWPNLKALELQYAAIVGGVIWLEPWLKSRLPKSLLFGGDASYSLYLVHPMVGALIATVLGKIGGFHHLFSMAIIIFACLAASAAIYIAFERPVTKWLRKAATV